MKTQDQVNEMIRVLGNDLMSLPDKDIFGDSNEEDKDYLCICIGELEDHLVGKSPSCGDVYDWLNNKFSILSDYE